MLERKTSSSAPVLFCGYATLCLVLFAADKTTFAQNGTQSTEIGKVGPPATLNPWDLVYNYSPQGPENSTADFTTTITTTTITTITTPPTSESSQNPITTQDTVLTTSKALEQTTLPDMNTEQSNTATDATGQNNNSNNTTSPGTLVASPNQTTPCDANASIDCRNGASCLSNGGGYSWCQCTDGWTGSLCEADINECDGDFEAHNKCAIEAECRNVVGGYNCSCRSGYFGDGYSCSFSDPCANKTCVKGSCLSELTSSKCFCDKGWTGDDCTQDVNECTVSGSSPVCTDVNSECINTNGSFICSCIQGYFRSSLNTCTENRIWRFGASNLTLAKTRNSKMSVDVAGGFPFYGQIFYQIQVSSNGYLMFGPDGQNLSFTRIYGAQFPPNVAMFAPYWSDIEISRQSESMVSVDVYNFWNTTLNLTQSEMFALLVSRTAPFLNFVPRFAAVVTWSKVVPYPAKIYSGFENATFQVVLATSGSRSVAFVNYAAGQMLWNPSSDNRTIVIGITDGAGTRFNFTGDVYRPDLSTGDGTGKKGQFFFDLGPSTNNPHLPCLDWYQSMNAAPTSSKTDPPVPCPCSLKQVSSDPRFVSDSNDLKIARDGEKCFRHRLSNSNGVNLCCYDRDYETLIVGLGGGYLKSNGAETDGKKRCCVDADICQVFYMKQTSDNCQNYTSPSIGAVWGDPYISSFAGEDFSFNGKGEYTLFHMSNELFWLQGRFEQNSRAALSNVTTLTAIAVKPANQSAFEVQLKDGSLRLHVNNQSVPLPGTGGSLAGSMVESTNNSNILFHFGCDIVIQLSVEAETLRLTVLLPNSLPGWSESTGLLVRKCSGAVLQGSSESEAFVYFSECLVAKNESAFSYVSDGNNYESINSKDFVPTFGVGGSLNSTNTPWCGSSKSCIREWAKTSNSIRALAAKIFEDGITNSRTNFANFPPVFSATQSYALYAAVNQELSIALNVSDPRGRNIRFTVNTVINHTEWHLDDNVFTWTPSTAKYNASTAAFLQFYATNDANSSALYWPYVHLCPCSVDRGRCAFNYPSKLDMKTPQGRLVIGQCVCLPGWTGDLCNQTKDVCSPNPCFPGVNCTSNLTSSASGYMCGSCPPGLVKDGNWCYDANECLTPLGLACSGCTNLLGAYICTCNGGYNLSPDRKTCIDVDECDKSGHCTYDGQYCHNLPGSYECLCRPDYFTNSSSVCLYAPIKFGGKLTFKMFNFTGAQYLSWADALADSKSENFKLIAQDVESLVKMMFAPVNGFVGVRATALQKGSIMALFNLLFKPDAMVNATYLNTLLAKYLQNRNCRINAPDCVVSNLIGINANMSDVYDKDLCVDPADNMCDLKTMDCHTESGQPLCDCKPGFQQITDYVEACEDIDECFLNIDNCNMNMSTCVNTPGSYMCSCVEGFEMNNGSCSDICDPNPCANDGLCLARGYDFVCDCVGIWTGLNCTEENPEAIKLRKIAIGVGVGLGVLCLILIVALIVTCIRQCRSRTSYACATVQNADDGNHYKGRRSVNLHQWDTDEVEFQANGSHLDRDSQPKTATFTGRDNPAYLDSTLEVDRSNGSGAKKTSSDYF